MSDGDLYEKVAFLPAVAAAGVSTAARMGAGAALRAGAGAVARFGGRALNALGTVSDVAQVAKTISGPPAAGKPPSPNSANRQATSQTAGGRTGYASYHEALSKESGFMGAVKAVGSFGGHATRATMGMGATGPLTGAARAGRAAGNALGTAGVAAGVASAVQGFMPEKKPEGRTGYASLDERFAKLAFNASNGINIASYLAMIGAELAPHESPWHTGLELAGLGGLGVSTVKNMYDNREERIPGLKDLAGIGLFASAVQDRAKMGAHVRRTEKTAILGPLISAELGLLPEVAGYALGKSHNYTPEEAEAVKARKHSFLSAMLIPGYTGYHIGTNYRAHKPEKPDILDFLKARDLVTKARTGLSGHLEDAASALSQG